MAYYQINTKRAHELRRYTANRRTVVYRSDGVLIFEAPTFYTHGRSHHKPHFTYLCDVHGENMADYHAYRYLRGGHSCCYSQMVTCDCVHNGPIMVTLPDGTTYEYNHHIRGSN